ncbi:Subtilase family protein [Lentzea albidocapillata subsp. violacea]|uniref:Subtilase family protein n=1 Tax=Lentzea albidocapillata subsp. violacea TaxID=128104 RepID=A0A1G9V7K7_9PSEU|nr:S8 family serine peptidase [Lentzea albidocapillata]SDM68046.1 Subtilase family protein [Lentzea albidocapillata subsp. violacea]
MRGKSKVLGAVTALALTVAPAATAAAAPPAGNAPQRTADEVTLVTGDKVLLGHDRQVVAIQPGEGRGNMAFKTALTADGHTMVVPKDAFEPLAAGRLDRRLFDVTTLLEFGYRDRMPLIVDGRARLGARSSDDWTALKAGAATGDKVWLDGIRKPSLDRSVAQIGAPAAHQKGITGKGIKVAIVDTGVDEKHPDLAGQQIAEKNFTSDPDTTDNVGHGTHVGSTVASHDSQYGGVAPGAQLLDAKVCVEFGCQESWILDGMRWAAEQGAQVVNMSLGGGDTPEVDPLEQAVNDLTAQYGTLFVVAAGNSGSPGSVSSPSTAEAALSVGAVDRDDKIAPFSSKGPRVGDSGLKPEVTAPGVDIVAAKAGTTDHFAASGTSMATPHVAGAAALLKQQHPEWTPAQLKSALATTAKPAEGVSAFDQGAGRINVAKAIEQVLTGDVAVNLGLHEWPHGDDKPVTKAITYTNPTDAAITLDLAFRGSAPAGMFTLGATKVTVPAKGTASVDVTGDSRAGTQDAAYAGEVVATSGAHTVRTLVGIDREVESYTLTIDMIGRDGQDPGTSFTFLVGLDNTTFKPVAGTGDVKIRLPKGTYFLDTTLYNGERGMDLLYQPTVKLTGDVTVKQDARLAQPVSVKAPEETGDFTLGIIAFRRAVDGQSRLQGTMLVFGGFEGVGIAQAGGPLPPGDLSSLAMLQANTTADPHTFYRLAYPVPGGLPVGLVKAPARKDLARVESTIGGQKPDSQASKGELPLSPQGLGGGTALYPVAPGATAVEYVTTEDMRWQSAIMTRHANGAQERITSALRTYKAGRTYREREVRPVFSPGLPESQYGFVERYGTQFYVGVPLTSDGTHGDGTSTVDSARTALYRNGVLLGETTTPGGVFTVPLPRADFRAEMSVDRSSQFEFSTKVSAVWTFKSQGTEGRIDAPPLSVVKFEPKLDANGAVPAGTLQRIGLLTQTQGDAGKVRITGVQYSHDDGKSWRRAGVVGNNALVYHPANAQWTSLKATATDAKGGTVELTVIRAYRVTAG